MDLNTPVLQLPGVGRARMEALNRLGIETVQDLLFTFPRTYQDRTKFCTIARAPSGEKVCIRARVLAPPQRVPTQSGRALVRVSVSDGTGGLTVAFFNQNYVSGRLQKGTEYIFYGAVEWYGRERQMVSPYFEPADRPKYTGRLLPVYPLTQGIRNSFLYGLEEIVFRDGPIRIPDPLPEDLRRRYALPELPAALREIHFPASRETLEQARDRFIFEELFCLSCALTLLRSRRKSGQGPAMQGAPVEEFLKLLPFRPTRAQQTAMDELTEDLCSGRPMNRLLQGDVGSGKTAVAAYGIWLAWKNGYQSALMAPTELLARQHFQTLSGMLGPAGIRVVLVTGSAGVKEKQEIRTALAEGTADLAVGTHALLSKGVDFCHLGLAVTDEQHRFGVAQRAALAAKAAVKPHLLVMSATPIPRTLALMIYGDLDLSVLDQLPPGRTPVTTTVLSGRRREDLYRSVRRQAEQGRQIYFVCPAVEEGEQADQDLKTVRAYAGKLAREIFPDLRVGLVHGRMKPKEKNEVMDRFARGKLDILVSTTVVEVGVDVPNATVMVVENAERFGLSQLHQLRGRVGRGPYPSYCVLVSDNPNPETRKRLQVMTETTDGFQISQEDLRQRGPGNFFGQQQHGLPKLRLASLAGDMRQLKLAQQAAQETIAQDPELTLPDHRGIRREIQTMFLEGRELEGPEDLVPD